MPKLIAYIPVLNNSHIKWFQENSGRDLILIPQKIAESLLPRLARNPTMISTEMMVDVLNSSRHVFGLNSVSIFSHDLGPSICSNDIFQAILPSEDISMLFSEEVLWPLGVKRTNFEYIWARWDMTAVKKQSPILSDVEISSDRVDILRIELAKNISGMSPDWWRCVGAAVFREDQILASSYNEHFPTEYEAGAKGDPRSNVDAGQIGHYLSLHAEKGVIAECAKRGLSTRDSSIYVTIFPCEDCARMIVASGMSELFFLEGYSVLNAQEVLKNRGVKITQVKTDPVAK